MSEISKTKIGQYLRLLRIRAGLKINDMAKILGVTHSYISLVESGKRIPGGTVLLRMATLFNKPVSKLIALVDEDKKQMQVNEKEKEEIEELIAKARLSNYYRILLSPYSKLNYDEMFKILKERRPDVVENLYQKAINDIPELKNCKGKKIAIKKWLLNTPTIGEKITRNILGDLGPKNLTYQEMIADLKNTFGWTWERMGIELGASGRTVQRWAKGETSISEKAKRRLDFLYYVVKGRMEKITAPLTHLYKEDPGISPEIICKQLEKIGIAEEIKERFVKKYPEVKKFRHNNLLDFFFKLSKQVAPLGEKRKIFLNKHFISYSQNKIPKNRGMKRERRGEKRRERGNNQQGQGEAESDEDDETWILKEKIKKGKIYRIAQMLFENLWIEFLTAGNIRGLHKEEAMKVRKRPDSPYYYIDIFFNGMRFRKSTRCTKKRDAENIGTLLLYKLWNQYSFDIFEKAPTFEEISEKFIEYQKKKGNSSWKREGECHRYVVPDLGKYTINQITPKHIQTVLEKIAEKTVRGGKKIAPRSVNYIRGYLHRMFEYAKNIEGTVKENPVDKIPPIKYDNRRMRILTPDEKNSLFNAIKDPVIKDAVEFVLLTGLREGEILQLKKSDFVSTGDFMYFRIKREKNKILTEFPVVWRRLEEIVRKYLNTAENRDAFFCYPDGEILKKWHLIEVFQKARKVAGIDDLNFNDLRRTFYSTLKLAGCDYLILEYLMGHKIPGITSRYFSFTVNDIAEHLKKLEGEIVPLLSHLEGKEE